MPPYQQAAPALARTQPHVAPMVRRATERRTDRGTNHRPQPHQPGASGSPPNHRLGHLAHDNTQCPNPGGRTTTAPTAHPRPALAAGARDLLLRPPSAAVLTAPRASSIAAHPTTWTTTARREPRSELTPHLSSTPASITTGSEDHRTNHPALTGPQGSAGCISPTASESHVPPSSANTSAVARPPTAALTHSWPRRQPYRRPRWGTRRRPIAREGMHVVPQPAAQAEVPW